MKRLALGATSEIASTLRTAEEEAEEAIVGEHTRSMSIKKLPGEDELPQHAEQRRVLARDAAK